VIRDQAVSLLLTLAAPPAAGAAVALLAASVACLPPALGPSRLDPAKVLREE